MLLHSSPTPLARREFIQRPCARKAVKVQAKALQEALSEMGFQCAAAFIGMRVPGMAVGGWITVGAFSIQIIIWWVTPDALEKWLDHSAFGNERATVGLKTAEEQAKALEGALAEMGF